MKNLTLNTTIGKIEFDILTRLSYDRTFNGKNIVKFSDIAAYLPEGYKYTTQFVSRLIKKNILSPIKKGIYTFNPIESMPVGVANFGFAVADAYMDGKDYYVGYSSLFNWYGFSEQMFQDVYVINNSVSSKKIIDNTTFHFIKVKKEFMYGIVAKEVSGGKVKISDKERTMIDLLYWNGAVGGMQQAMKIVEENIKEQKCDVQKFIDYAIKYQRLSIRKIIGVALDNALIDDKLTKPLYETIKNTSLTSAKWDKRNGTKNGKWRVIIQ